MRMTIAPRWRADGRAHDQMGEPLLSRDAMAALHRQTQVAISLNYTQVERESCSRAHVRPVSATG